MRLEEAREHIGDGVLYKASGPEAPEDGVILRCSQSMVFVSYKGVPKATRPEDLVLMPADWTLA